MRYSSRILPILIIVAAAATFTFAGCKKKDMSLKLNEPRNIRGVVSYKRSFGDLNEKHLNVAQAIGIRVLSSREEAEKMREQLQPITTNELYAVDSLTHSIPYLIPGAASLPGHVCARTGGRCCLQEAGGSGDDGGGYSCLPAASVEDAGRIRREV